MAIVRMPTTAEVISTFQPYAQSLGQVAHAWNYLQESLGRMFVFVTGLEARIAFPIWYSTTSDRAQRAMLQAAVTATDDLWASKFPKFSADLKWLLKEAEKVADHRNDVVHAPCCLMVGGTGLQIMPAYFDGNPRARKLQGKSILETFAFYGASAETLSSFSNEISGALAGHKKAWPERPAMPVRRYVKKDVK